VNERLPPDINNCDGVFPTDLLTAGTDGDNIVTAGEIIQTAALLVHSMRKTVQRERERAISICVLYPYCFHL
jgi:hypothetical protein